VAVPIYFTGVTWWAFAMGPLSMLGFAFTYMVVALFFGLLGWSLSGKMQIPLMQHPGCPLSMMVLPWLSFAQGLQLCDNAFVHTLRQSLGNNYVFASMVSLGEYEMVEATLKGRQERTKNLGAQPLTNLPKVDREIFFLQLANIAEDNNHDKFVSCFKHYMFSQGFLERKKSDKAAKFWKQLAEDYKTMGNGPGEHFHKSDDRGLRGFFIRYFFYVMLGLDTEDTEVFNTLLVLMKGDAPIAKAYLWPFALAGAANGAIRDIDVMIEKKAAALQNYVEGEERFGKLSKVELSRLCTCIFRLAAITGTLQLAQTVTGGKTLPPFKGMEKIDLVEYWDKMDLRDVNALEKFCYEAGRIYPPVSSVHHVATEPFSAKLQGSTVNFPAGTKVLVPTNIAMTDEEVWGPDAFTFNPNRPRLMERNMVFANVGPGGTRVCPGANIAIDTCVEILQVLGEVRRSG